MKNTQASDHNFKTCVMKKIHQIKSVLKNIHIWSLMVLYPSFILLMLSFFIFNS